MSAWRKTTNSRLGTTTKYSAADFNALVDLLNGVDTGKAVAINNDWNFVRAPTGVSGGTIADNSITDAKIAAQTSTKITITDKSHLPNDIIYNPTSLADGDIIKRIGGVWVRHAKGTANQVLAMNADATDLTWTTGGTGGGGGNYEDFNIQGSPPANPGAGHGYFYMKTIDSNNEGVFAKVKKGGAVVEVQIA